MDDKVEIIRSNKGGMKIIHRGYMYTVHKKRQSGGIRWRCTQRSLHCKGSISTGNGVTKVNMPHNHMPDLHSVALARCRQSEEITDVSSLVEMDYDDVIDSMPLQQRLDALQALPKLQVPSGSESTLKSKSLSPTKLKVMRQNQPILPKPEEKSPPPSVTEDEVCLRWNSHHSNMQNAFPSLLQREQYVDVTLASEGKILKCHRLILSSCSSYFDEILSTITPSQHPVIFMKDIPFWILKSLCDFMYAGEVHIDQNKLEELLQVAEVLKIKGLARKSNTAPLNPSPSADPLKINKPPQQQSFPKILKQLPKPSVLTQQQSKLVGPVDPLQLLQPLSFHEEPVNKSQNIFKLRDPKIAMKKPPPKKLKKRKSPEADIPSRMLHFRKGTRSRPNVKVPKYYHSDYEDIIKPTSRDSGEMDDTLFPIETIKSEPIDVVENDIAYSDSDMAVPFLHLGDVNPLLMEQQDKEDDNDIEEADNFVKITLSTAHLRRDLDVDIEGGTEELENENGTIEEAIQTLKESGAVQISTQPHPEAEKTKGGLLIQLVNDPAATNNIPEDQETKTEGSQAEEERPMPVLSPKECVPAVSHGEEDVNSKTGDGNSARVSVDVVKE